MRRIEKHEEIISKLEEVNRSMVGKIKRLELQNNTFQEKNDELKHNFEHMLEWNSLNTIKNSTKNNIFNNLWVMVRVVLFMYMSMKYIIEESFNSNSSLKKELP